MKQLKESLDETMDICLTILRTHCRQTPQTFLVQILLKPLVGFPEVFTFKFLEEYLRQLLEKLLVEFLEKFPVELLEKCQKEFP